MKRHPVDREKCVIKPSDINAASGHHFWETFDHTETECSAIWIVRLCQKLGGWVPFTEAQLDEVCKHDFRFNHLLDYRYAEDGWVHKQEDGTYVVTHEFVAQVYMHNPAGCESVPPA